MGQSRMDNPKKQRTQDEDRKKNHNTLYLGHHYAQANTNNVLRNDPSLLPTTGGKDEPNIIIEDKKHTTWDVINPDACTSSYLNSLSMLNEMYP